MSLPKEGRAKWQSVCEVMSCKVFCDRLGSVRRSGREDCYARLTYRSMWSLLGVRSTDYIEADAEHRMQATDRRKHRPLVFH